MEQSKQTNLELNQKELQEVTGGDWKIGAAIGGAGLGVSGALGLGARHIGNQIRAVGNNVAITRATAEATLEHTRTVSTAVQILLHR
jgi:lactobin A/cerein 7B family class IIb bacteriocin